MIRNLVTRGLQVAVAAALMRAGAASACPTPPQTNQCTLVPTAVASCTDSGSSDLDVAVNAGQKTTNATYPSLTNYWRVNLLATRNYGWGGVNVCDGMVLFTLNDITVSLADSASTPLRNVRITEVASVSNPSGGATNPYYERYGSGAFCLWASETDARYSKQIYLVSVEAFDLAGDVHQGQVAIEVVCTGQAAATPAPTSQTTYYQKSTSGTQTLPDFCTHMNTECVAEAELPDTCGAACQCSCITVEGASCGDGTGGGDTGPADGGPTDGGDTGPTDGGTAGGGDTACVPVEGYDCSTSDVGTASDTGSAGSSASASTESGASTDGGSGAGSTGGTSGAAPSGGCSAFALADPSLGALLLVGLGLRRRRRSNS